MKKLTPEKTIKMLDFAWSLYIKWQNYKSKPTSKMTFPQWFHAQYEKARIGLS